VPRSASTSLRSNRPARLGLRGILALLGVALAPGAVAQQQQTTDGRSSDVYAWFDPLIEVQHLIASRFVTRPDLEAMQQGAISGMLEALGDDYTQFVPAEALRAVTMKNRGEYVGIGASVRMEDGWVTIVTPLDDSPAYEAGILAGDRVVAVNGESTMGKSLDEVIDLLTGVPGTTVQVTVERNGDRMELPIVRQEIVTRTVAGFRRTPDETWDYLIDPESRIGYIRVSQFTGGTMPEFREAIEGLREQGVEGLIIDLRFNPGGMLSTAISMADLFLEEGLIVSTKGRAHAEDAAYASPGDTITDLPLLIILNRRSASASEVVAGALRDNDRAVVLGERSFGKGSVQSVRPLPSGAGQLKMTEQRYYGPSGRPIHREDDSTEWGVDPTPGFFVPMSDEQYTEMLRVRRESEIIGDAMEANADDSEADAGAGVGDPEWIERRLKDHQLAASVRAMRQRVRTGEWSPPEEAEGQPTPELAELRRMQTIRERLRRELERVQTRIDAVADLVPEDEVQRPRLLPENVALSGGALVVRDAEGNVVAELTITGDDLEPWLVDAPIAPKEAAPAGAGG